MVEQELIDRANENLDIVRRKVKSGKPIRVWYSNQPDDMCGFYWFMGQVNNFKIHCDQVYIIKLPDIEADEKGNTIWKNGCGEMAPEDWHRYLALQTAVSPSFIQSCASHWQALQRENSPLRAVLNGQLISVPESIYDSFIQGEIEEAGEEFHEARIIGNVLGKHKLGISDAWVAFRIEKMIQGGLFEVLSQPLKDMPTYHRTLKKRIHTAIY
jgi:hypothetical protein